MTEKIWWQRSFVALGGLGLLITACSKPSQFRVMNDTQDEVTLISCAQDPHLNRLLAPGSAFSFTDNVGSRTLADDPGFACAVQRGSRLLCLPLPTDQSGRSRFLVSAAVQTASMSDCFANSNPHL